MTVEREDRGEIALLQMNRGKVNALDAELLQGLGDALDGVEASPARALVLTGAGPAFSAGVDLFRLLEGGPAHIREFLPLLSGILRRLYAFPKPTVAAVNGHAIAGGHLLMASCDRRILARGPGKVGVPELRVGVPFPPMALEILRATLPPGRLADLVLAGSTFSAEEALSLGLVHTLEGPADLLDRAFEEARGLAALPAAAFWLTKRQLVAPALERADRLEKELGGELGAVWASAETAAAIRSYLERTVGRRE